MPRPVCIDCKTVLTFSNTRGQKMPGVCNPCRRKRADERAKIKKPKGARFDP